MIFDLNLSNLKVEKIDKKFAIRQRYGKPLNFETCCGHFSSGVCHFTICIWFLVFPVGALRHITYHSKYWITGLFSN